MHIVKEWFPEFEEQLGSLDETYRNERAIDEKTYQFICLALAIRGRSAPCVRKHFTEALQAGATMKEIASVIALTFRESAGNDDCWVSEVLADSKKIMEEGVSCDCKS